VLYKRTEDCINEYRNVLLDVLNTYYDKGCLKYPETSDNAKARIEYQRTKRDSCKPEDVSSQKGIVSKLQEDYEKVKELENKYTAFVGSLLNILKEFKSIEIECGISEFRFGFIEGEYKYFETENYDDNLEDAARSIIENFEHYLRSLTNKRVMKREAVKTVSDLMEDQKNKHLQRYESKLRRYIDDEKILSKDKYIFQKRDEIYFIKYENEEFELKKTKGLEYIRCLLSNPYNRNKSKTKFTPKRLYDEVNKAPRLPDINKMDAIVEAYCEDKGFAIEGHGEYADMVDEKTKKKINELKLEIEIAVTTGNEDKAKELQSEFDEFKKEYINKKILGKGGKSLKFPSALHKKPYDNIRQAMDVVCKKMGRLSNEKGYNSMLTLNHFDKAIYFRDSHFFYKPEILPDWQF